ncbi:MAG: ATP-binding protein [Candidatus Cloacimonetes bacterium]|nr:ATP-binding protein [Candidatus Cloacimonadota bacterium]MCF7812997.1 ATP-binding protein [Candidatus Cloacimonadota bacterium]MCF7867271.1 ATP-binding protein [Candidatus Cloacimonadota bacterium]MCF7882715.1 ATP-binding protein [Candidatus Cloacimonadota bacterium]
MKVITKIHIENFRSFCGTRKDDTAEVVDVADLNIFSGANDSGKSNVLRALNLFFNNEVNRGQSFNHISDLNIQKRKSGNRVVKIQLDFDISWDNKRDKFLPSRFSISKFYDVNGFRNYWYEFKIKNISKTIRIDSRADKNRLVYHVFLPDNFEKLDDKTKSNLEERAKKREWNYRVKFSGFLNRSVSFQYVPAIKDESFFSYLYGKTILQLLSNEENSVNKLLSKKDEIENWQSFIKKKKLKPEKRKNLKDKKWRIKELNDIESRIKATSKMQSAIRSLENQINKFSDSLFSSTTFLSSEFKVGDDLRDFFENFDIGTGTNKTLSLKLRGDGIRARFIPQILDFVDSIQNDKKYFLWGFEEPENSSEYRNQKALADILKKDFSRNKQIFVTTHSEEFLSIYDGKEIENSERKANLYHVKKASSDKFSDFSVIKIFDVENQTFEFSTTKSDIEDDLGTSLIRAKYSKELKEKEKQFLKEKEVLEKQNGPILYVEGLFEECVFKKILGDNINFEIKSANSANGVAKKIIGSSFKDSRHKVLGLFDHDSAGKNAVSFIKDNRNENNLVKNEYIKPNNRLIEILQKQGIEYSIDELLPDFIWDYLYNNDFLEDANKFEIRAIPNNLSLDEYLRGKFIEDNIAIIKVSKKIKRVKKDDFRNYIIDLNETHFQEIIISLQPTLQIIKDYFS